MKEYYVLREMGKEVMLNEVQLCCAHEVTPALAYTVVDADANHSSRISSLMERKLYSG